MSIDDLILDFNEGNTNFLKYFGDDVTTFLKVVHRRGKFDDLDTSKLDDDYQNEFLLFLHEINKEKFWKEVLNYLDLCRSNCCSRRCHYAKLLWIQI